MKLEAVAIPVSDVDRAKDFYAALVQRDDEWPAWYASFMVSENAGTEPPT